MELARRSFKTKSSLTTARAGWLREKGQVENQVGLVRERFFTPRLRVKSLEELNAWLMDKCVAYAKAHRHPEQTDKTIWEMFEAERPLLVPYVGPFDGFHSVPASVSKTCTVRFDVSAVLPPPSAWRVDLGSEPSVIDGREVLRGDYIGGSHDRPWRTARSQEMAGWGEGADRCRDASTGRDR
jgi:hypothetical protein